MKLKITAKVPILLIVVFLLVFAANNYLSTSANTTTKYVIAITVSLAVYLIPSAVYIFTKPQGFIKKMSPKRLKMSHIPIIASATLLVIFSASLYTVITYNFSASTQNTYQTFSENPIISILLLTILPAFLEELLFRGIVLTEYSVYGKFTAVLFSSVCFAIFHQSLIGFIYYFAAGMVIGFTAITTGSLFASFAVHFLSNLFFTFGERYVINLISNYSESAFVITVALILTLIALFFYLSVLDKYYSKLAYAKPDENAPEKIENTKKITIPRALAESFLSPFFLVLAIIFVALSLGIL